MKPIKTIGTLIITALLFVACSDENDAPEIVVATNPLEGYNLLTTIDANGHTIELYSENEMYTQGYNEIYVQIKNMDDGTFYSQLQMNWMPIMHMIDREHSCPKSTLETTEIQGVLKGYLVFQMASNSEEYWDITLDYQVDGEEYSITEGIEVNAPVDGMQRVTTFTGSDDINYVLAMMPFDPEVAVNDFSAMLYTMQDMMTFPMVEDYRVTIDPRMPSMDNHSSPNNEDLTYDAATGMYNGKLSLTMTGYWKINLKVMDANDGVLKGEDVTEENEGSSLYFEIEF